MNRNINYSFYKVSRIIIGLLLFISAHYANAQALDQYVGNTSVYINQTMTYSYTYSTTNIHAPFFSPVWSVTKGTVVSSSVSGDRMTATVTVNWTSTGAGSLHVTDDVTLPNYNVTINACPTLGTPTNLGPTTVCSGTSAQLTGTSGSNGNTIAWYTASTGGTLLGAPGYTTPVLTANTTYYGASYNTSTGCTGATRVALNITMLAAPTSAPTAICSKPAYGRGNAVLTASNPTYTNFRWYTTSSGGTATTGSNFTASNITSPTTYYVCTYITSTGCESTRTSVVADVLPVTSTYSIQQDLIRVSGVTQDAQTYTLTESQKNTTFSYGDGLSRTVQVVALKSSPLGNDIVQPVEYDAFGRSRKTYLPYVATTTTGAFHGSSAYPVEQRNFYKAANDKIANDTSFAIANFETSPLGRILEQGGVGASWQPGATTSMPGVHTKRITYSYNTGANSNNDDVEEVRKFYSSGKSFGFYAANILSRTAVTDENGNKDITFTDALGNTIVHKQQLDSMINGIRVHYLQTYYVYDTMNRLKYIIPPAGQAALKSGNWILTQPILDQHLHQFVYDAQGRMIQKKTPGQAWSYFVYDNMNRVILTQDGNLRPLNKWAFVKYDGKGRTVMSGLYTNASLTDQTTAQTTVSNWYNNVSNPYYESRVTNNAFHGYTNQSFPTINANSSALEILSVAYFDDYDFDGNGSADYKYDSTNAPGTTSFWKPYGFSTGSKKLVLGSSTWLYTYTFYDTWGRPIQTRSNNHLSSTVDNLTTVVYDAVEFNKVVQTITYHNAGGTNQTTISQKPVYDTKGRLTQVKHNINHITDPTFDQIVAQYQYNELGQMVTKQLHNTGGTNFLQNVDYRYNIRGWLTSINNAQLANDNGATNNDTNDYFGMELLYNSADASGLANTQYYNGNISAIKWKGAGNGNTASGQRSYKFTYDKTDKLTAATFQKYGTAWNQETNTLNETMSYDHNGNIVTLQRNQNQRGLIGTTVTSTAQTIDNLTYTYAKANQLSKVTDASANAAGFSDGINTTTEYKYDSLATLGNLMVDKNKGIDSIKYNVLNKPYRMKMHDGRLITYTYDAAGNKLKMTSIVSGTTTTTDYVGGFVYTNSALSFFSSPEGRVVKNLSGNYEYQYSIVDHQGNTRVVFTSATQAPISTLATFEGDSNDQSSQFSNVTTIPYGAANHTAGGTKVIRLNQTTPIGPGISKKVYSGDLVDMEAYSYYEASSGYGTTSAPLTGASGLINSISNVLIASTGGIDGGGLKSSGVNGALTNFGIGANQGDGAPAAFLNYILFDQNYKVMDAGWQVVTATAFSKQKVSLPTITVKEAGFIFVYLSYEDQSNNYVYFDDFKVTVTPSNIIQSNEYYPFGLQTANSWTRDNNSNNFLYDAGSEINATSGLYDLPYRNYDAALGRFHQIDPLAHVTHSLNPYHYSGNNPIGSNDPSGLKPMEYTAHTIVSPWNGFDFDLLNDWANDGNSGNGGGGRRDTFANADDYFSSMNIMSILEDWAKEKGISLNSEDGKYVMSWVTTENISAEEIASIGTPTTTSAPHVHGFVVYQSSSASSWFDRFSFEGEISVGAQGGINLNHDIEARLNVASTPLIGGSLGRENKVDYPGANPKGITVKQSAGVGLANFSYGWDRQFLGKSFGTEGLTDKISVTYPVIPLILNGFNETEIGPNGQSVDHSGFSIELSGGLIIMGSFSLKYYVD